MDKLTTKKNSSLSNIEQKNMCIYQGTLTHRFRNTMYVESARIGTDYYFTTDDFEDVAGTILNIYEIRTQNLACRLQMPDGLDVKSLFIIPKSQSEKRIAVLCNTTSFIIIKDVQNNAVLSIHPMAEDTKVKNRSRGGMHDGPLYFEGSIFYMAKIGKYGVTRVKKYNIENRLSMELQSSLFYISKSIGHINNSNGKFKISGNRLFSYFDTDGLKSNLYYDLFDIESGVRIDKGLMHAYDKTGIEMGLINKSSQGMEEENITFQSYSGSEEILMKFNISTKDIVFRINLTEIKDTIEEHYSEYKHKKYSYCARVLNAFLSNDGKTLVLSLEDIDNKVCIIYDLKNRAPVCQLDIYYGQCMPEYFISILKERAFDAQAIAHIIDDYYKLMLYWPLYKSEDYGPYYMHGKDNGQIFVEKYRDVRFIFNIDRLRYEESSIIAKDYSIGEISTCQSSSIILFADNGSELDFTGDNSNIQARKITAYDPAKNRIFDTKVIPFRFNSDFFIPHYQVPTIIKKDKYSGKEREAYTLDKGKIQTYHSSDSIVDISNDYILRASENEDKLHIYSRWEQYITTIVLSERFYTAYLSNRTDHIYVYYGYGRAGDNRLINTVKVYSISDAEKGFFDAKYTFESVNPPHNEFKSKFMESMDGRYLYCVAYEKEEMRERLKIFDTHKDKMLFDDVMPLKEIAVINIDFIDSKMRYMIINDEYYFNPLTVEVLGILHRLTRKKFLFRPSIDGKESQFFYTNAPDMVHVYQKEGKEGGKLLEVSHVKRMEYLSIYNARAKVLDILFNPEKFKRDKCVLRGLRTKQQELLLMENNRILMDE